MQSLQSVQQVKKVWKKQRKKREKSWNRSMPLTKERFCSNLRKAAQQPFRSTKAEAISYFVGGEVSEDHGFAFTTLEEGPF